MAHSPYTFPPEWSRRPSTLLDLASTIRGRQVATPRRRRLQKSADSELALGQVTSGVDQRQAEHPLVGPCVGNRRHKPAGRPSVAAGWLTWSELSDAGATLRGVPLAALTAQIQSTDLPSGPGSLGRLRPRIHASPRGTTSSSSMRERCSDGNYAECQSDLLESPDGTTWAVAASISQPPSRALISLTPDDLGFFASARLYEGSTPSLWFSQDGSTWESVGEQLPLNVPDCERVDGVDVGVIYRRRLPNRGAGHRLLRCADLLPRVDLSRRPLLDEHRAVRPARGGRGARRLRWRLQETGARRNATILYRATDSTGLRRRHPELRSRRPKSRRPFRSRMASSPSDREWCPPLLMAGRCTRT